MKVQQTNTLQVVILRCPYANWEDEEMQSLYGKMVHLKLKGYLRKYDFGVLPVDTSDYFSDHILFCIRNEKGDWMPISGTKSLSYEICPRFRYEFTPVAFMKNHQNLRHLEALHGVVEKCERQGKKINYFSSWTMDPDYKKDVTLKQYAVESLGAILSYYLVDNDIAESIAIGLPDFKTDELLCSWGYRPLQWQNCPLDAVPLPNFGNRAGLVVHLKNFSGFARQLQRKYSQLWSERIVIGKSYQECMVRDGALQLAA